MCAVQCIICKQNNWNVIIFFHAKNAISCWEFMFVDCSGNHISHILFIQWFALMNRGFWPWMNNEHSTRMSLHQTLLYHSNPTSRMKRYKRLHCSTTYSMFNLFYWCWNRRWVHQIFMCWNRCAKIQFAQIKWYEYPDFLFRLFSLSLEFEPIHFFSQSIHYTTWR